MQPIIQAARSAPPVGFARLLFVLWATFSLVAPPATGQDGGHLDRFEYSARHMGVIARCVVFAEDEARAAEAARSAFHRIAELDAVFSTYRTDSELTRLNAAAHPVWMPISDDMATVLLAARRVWRASAGAFDPTVGPMVDLWRRSTRSGRLPGRAALDSARARVGFEHVHLDSTRRLIRFDAPGIRLDLGGIAKGYAADQALAVLTAAGLPSAFVELGGDLVFGASPPGGPGWSVAATPLSGLRTGLAIEHLAVSTSGDGHQHVEIDGVRYSHVVDPRTGLGVGHGAAVTVLAPSGLMADATATALSVAGPCTRAGGLERLGPIHIYFRTDTPGTASANGANAKECG